MRRGLAAVVAVALVARMSDAAPAAAPSPALALAALDRRIADLDSEELATRRELTQLSPSASLTHARVLRRNRDYYKLTRAGMLPVGAGFEALVTHAMRVERARHAVEHEISGEQRLRARGAALASNLERVARDREALSSQRSAMDAARLAVDDEARRQAAFNKAFESSAGDGEYVAVGSAASDAPGGFGAARGKLLMPLAARAQIRQTRREGADGPGLEFGCPEGAIVRAVYTGRVAFADRYGAFGRIVIIDHGDHYYTVSGNLGAVDVHIGDDIAAGERIGTAGDDGAGAMLYFEVRHGSQTIAPGPWLGL